jgi:hypothetical protein
MQTWSILSFSLSESQYMRDVSGAARCCADAACSGGDNGGTIAAVASGDFAM